MKYFRITRIWSVKAEDEAEAFHQIAADPNEHFESEAVTRTEYKKPKQETGWGAGFRNQLVGSNSKRWVASDCDAIERVSLPPTRAWGKPHEFKRGGPGAVGGGAAVPVESRRQVRAGLGGQGTFPRPAAPTDA